MNTGIVILNYNDAESAINLADSIKNYKALDHIVIVDNSSTDDSFDRLTEYYKGNSKISVVASGKNGGYSYGNNFGARYLINNFKTDMIIISNPDVFFKEKVVDALTKGFEEHPECGVLTAVMTRPDGQVDPVPYRKLFSYAHDLGDCFLSVRRLVYENKRFEVDYSAAVMKVQVVQGSFFAITAKAFEDIHGLDENIFLYYEELILAKKLQQAGYETGLLTGYVYIHNHSVTIRRAMNNIRIWKAVLKSKYYYQKNYNHANVLQMGLLRICGFFSIIEKFMIEVFRKML